MKKIFGAMLMLVALALLLGACADDDDNGDGGDGASEIRTEKGLAVALAAQAGVKFDERQTSGGAVEDGSEGAPSYRGGDTTDSAGGVAQQAAFEGLTVTGYGVASASADSAIVEFYFSSSSAYPRPAQEGSGGGTDSGSSGGDTPSQGTTIERADLQAVIDAVRAAGVAEEDIEFIGGSYYDPYYASATLRVTVRDIGNMGNVVGAATDAATTLTDVYLQGTYVSYTLNDCAELQAAALRVAVEDAQEQGDALASAVGVARGGVSGASSYSYAPYGGTACSSGNIGPYPMGGVAYAEDQGNQVQVYATVTITYAIQ